MSPGRPARRPAPPPTPRSYPQLFSAAQRGAFAAATDQLMAQSGMSLVNVIGVAPSAQSVAPLLAQPHVDGVMSAPRPRRRPRRPAHRRGSYFTFGVADQGYAGLHGNVAYVGGKPVVGLRSCLWGDGAAGDKVGVPGLVRELQGEPPPPAPPPAAGAHPAGSAAQGPRRPAELQHRRERDGQRLGARRAAGPPRRRPTPPQDSIGNATRLLHALGGFEVVLPEELLRRLARRTGARQQCPMPAGQWAAQAGDLPKCWLPRGGGCVFTCNQPRSLPVPARCDLAVCSNLTLEGLRFRCAADGAVCPARGQGGL